MRWRGAIRALAAAQRRSERAALRRQRELAQRERLLQELDSIERAALEVEAYENRIERLLSIHKDVGETIDWLSLSQSNPPGEPRKQHVYEKRAREFFNLYKPTAVDRVLGRATKKQDDLMENVYRGKEKDDEIWKHQFKEYQSHLENWKEMQDLALRVLDNQLEAYKEVLAEGNVLNEVKEIGSTIHFAFSNTKIASIDIDMNGQDVIPSHTKTLLKSGKVSVKEMPKSRYFEIYQDYICACVLRVAREVFALLPFDMLIITGWVEILNNQTGHLQNQPIISVAVSRDTLNSLNFDALDPSNAMANFVNRMEFKRGSGFGIIEPLKKSDFSKADAIPEQDRKLPPK